MKEVRELIHTRKQGVKEIDIQAAEDKLAVTFPEQYRDLFKLVNNAEIGEWILYPVKDEGNPKSWDDVVRQNTEVREDRMPGDFIAIGEDGSGDKLCLKTSNGIIEDQIYLWYHETAEVEDYAASLREFIVRKTEEG
ncbi:SMI1/KNR4 family protein [Peribacillus kribbensis]|uniref:SMI1/KNR4 family protein n=1 Tax=Peribacillus kribbensis TaxID=356658 RepID=UPI0004107638|nr:SMI1/KNR4 family protein [Peribacillus kribbensis]